MFVYIVQKGIVKNKKKSREIECILVHQQLALIKTLHIDQYVEEGQLVQLDHWRQRVLQLLEVPRYEY